MRTQPLNLRQESIDLDSTQPQALLSTQSSESIKHSARNPAKKTSTREASKRGRSSLIESPQEIWATELEQPRSRTIQLPGGTPEPSDLHPEFEVEEASVRRTKAWVQPQASPKARTERRELQLPFEKPRGMPPAQNSAVTPQSAERTVVTQPSSADPFIAAPTDLEFQIQQINQLSAQLEQAIVQLQATGYLDTTGLEQTLAAVPQIYAHLPGKAALLMRTIEPLRAQQEAQSNAELLRHLSHKKHPGSTGVRATYPLGRSLLPKSTLSSWRWFRIVVRPPRDLVSLVSDAVVWVAVAAGLRVGLQMLLSLYPWLWLPALLLLVVPVMVSLYQISLMSQGGRILGYRALLVLAGLLLGGRL